MGRRDCFKSRIGTTFHAKRWLALDITGLCSVSVSFGIHIFAMHVTYNHLLSDSNISQFIFYIFYLPSSLLAFANLIMAWKTNPGAVPLGARPLMIPIEASSTDDSVPPSSPDNGNNNGVSDGVSLMNNTRSDGDLALVPLTRPGSPKSGIHNNNSRSLSPSNTSSASNTVKNQRMRGIRRCAKCNDNYKPPRAHHDSVTGRPWVGNAVGALNHKFFVLFIFYTVITCFTCVILLVLRFIRCGYVTDNNDDETTINSQNPDYYDTDDLSPHHSPFLYSGCEGIYSIPVISLCFLSVIFLVFTCCMLIEQLDVIESNTSKIARMKIRMGLSNQDEFTKVSNNFNEMFGGNHPNVALHWFLPTPVRYPDGMVEKVLGFEYKDSWYGEVYREDMDDLETGSTMVIEGVDIAMSSKDKDDDTHSLSSRSRKSRASIT